MTQWYDAGLAPRTWRTLQMFSSFLVGVSPHAETSRWSYTVPTGKVAMVTLLEAVVMRSGSATTSLWYRADIRRNNTNILRAMNISNSLGVESVRILEGAIPLLTSDTLAAVTADGSTGGTVDYVEFALILEIP